MTIDECNEHIRRYIKNDKTRRAIMLTAPWGSGKSYYITHHLSPYLNKHELTCVIVSLYGLNSIKDINKELFLEIKFQRFRRKLKYINPFFKTITSGIAGVGKTLLKNLANIDLNLNLSEPNYKKLYESVNLKDKLIIFEDIERSSINLADFMGYVNNLVEQDGIKVLLVANEDEIFRCSQRTDNDELEEKTYSNYLPGAKEYIRFKEKTVGDTIKFYPSLEESIEAILGMFEGDLFDLVVKDNVKCICTKIIDNVMLLKSIDTINLRSLIYACQKTIDMFERITSNADKDFLEHVFMSHIAFVLRKDTYDNLKWESTIDTDCNLGTPKYPIYKFSYDFITAQRFDNKAFESANNAFCASRDFNNKQDRLKEQLHIIYEYYICKESQVLSAVHFVLTSLKSENDIPFEEYVKLMNYLIAIKWDLECFDLIDSCKKAMFNNLERSVSVTSAQLISSGGFQLETEEQLQEFAQFESEISQLVKKKNYDISLFDYSVQNFTNFCLKIEEMKDDFAQNGSFLRDIDIDKLANILPECSARQIDDLRRTFRTIYRAYNVKETFKDDVEKLKLLKTKIEIIRVNSDKMDRIQVKQLGYFENNLRDIISRME